MKFYSKKKIKGPQKKDDIYNDKDKPKKFRNLFIYLFPPPLNPHQHSFFLHSTERPLYGERK